MNAAILSDGRIGGIPTISFIVPVYNEKKTILSVLDVLSRFPTAHEIIVVDDGSCDGTREILSSTARPNLLILFHEKNAGKGTAVRTGVEYARGRYVAIQDADLEYDPMEYVELLRLATAENKSAVFGSRFLRKNPAIYWRYLMGNKLMTFWINLLTGAGLTDSYTCFKLLTRDLFASLGLTSNGFEMEAEICVKVARRGVPIHEIPIHYKPRLIEEGKKIKAKDALQGAITAFRIRFTGR